MICDPTLPNHIKSCNNLAVPIPRLLDSGANFTAWHLENWQIELLHEHNPIRAIQPGGKLMEGSTEATMKKTLTTISSTRNVQWEVLLTLKNHSIISLGKIYGTECEVLLTKDKALVLHNGRVILGSIRKANDLWYLHEDPVQSM